MKWFLGRTIHGMFFGYQAGMLAFYNETMFPDGMIFHVLTLLIICDAIVIFDYLARKQWNWKT